MGVDPLPVAQMRKFTEPAEVAPTDNQAGARRRFTSEARMMGQSPSYESEEPDENLRHLTAEERELLANPVFEPPDPSAVAPDPDMGITDVPNAEILDEGPWVDVTQYQGWPDSPYGHVREVDQDEGMA
jgi:hypothetical protein